MQKDATLDPLAAALEFVNADCRRAYIDLVQLRDAFIVAQSDLKNDIKDPTILFLDYSIIYPLVTPRNNTAPTPGTNKQDFAAVQFLNNIGKYKNSSRLIPVYSPFLILELFDQIKHRQTFLSNVLKTSTPRDMISAIKNALPEIPADPIRLEEEIRRFSANIGDVRLTDRLGEFLGLIKDGVIRSIFDFVKPPAFYDYFQQHADLIEEIYIDIDKFRRGSVSSDLQDHEFHKIIDVFIVTFIKAVRRDTNHRIVFVGPDRLLRIFGSQMKELTRDILSPFILVRSLTEAPSDRVLVDEALANMAHRQTKIERIMEDLYNHRRSAKLPFAVLQDIYRDETSVKEFLYGGFKMETEENYRNIINKLANEIPNIKDSFKAAQDDAQKAENMLKELADSAINKDFEQILSLRPNARLEKLLSDLQIKHR